MFCAPRDCTVHTKHVAVLSVRNKNNWRFNCWANERKAFNVHCNWTAICNFMLWHYFCECTFCKHKEGSGIFAVLVNHCKLKVKYVRKFWQQYSFYRCMVHLVGYYCRRGKIWEILLTALLFYKEKANDGKRLQIGLSFYEDRLQTI